MYWTEFDLHSQNLADRLLSNGLNRIRLALLQSLTFIELGGFSIFLLTLHQDVVFKIKIGIKHKGFIRHINQFLITEHLNGILSADNIYRTRKRLPFRTVSLFLLL